MRISWRALQVEGRSYAGHRDGSKQKVFEIDQEDWLRAFIQRLGTLDTVAHKSDKVLALVELMIKK